MIVDPEVLGCQLSIVTGVSEFVWLALLCVTMFALEFKK